MIDCALSSISKKVLNHSHAHPCQRLDFFENGVKGLTDVPERDVFRCIKLDYSLDLVNHVKQSTMHHSSIM
jgi:hypothetical protein